MPHFLTYTVQRLIQELEQCPPNFLVAADFDYEITGEMVLEVYNPEDLVTPTTTLLLNGSHEGDS